MYAHGQREGPDSQPHAQVTEKLQQMASPLMKKLDRGQSVSHCLGGVKVKCEKLQENKQRVQGRWKGGQPIIKCERQKQPQMEIVVCCCAWGKS